MVTITKNSTRQQQHRIPNTSERNFNFKPKRTIESNDKWEDGVMEDREEPPSLYTQMTISNR